MSTGGEDVLEVGVKITGTEQAKRDMRSLFQAAGGGATGRAAVQTAMDLHAAQVMRTGVQIQRGGATTGSRSLDEAIVRQATREATRRALPGVMQQLLGERDLQRQRRETARLEQQTAQQAARDRRQTTIAAGRAVGAGAPVERATVEMATLANQVGQAARATAASGQVRESARLSIIGSRLRRNVSRAERALEQSVADQAAVHAALRTARGAGTGVPELDEPAVRRGITAAGRQGNLEAAQELSDRTARQREQRSSERRRVSRARRLADQRAADQIAIDEALAAARGGGTGVPELDQPARRRGIAAAGRQANLPAAQELSQRLSQEREDRSSQRREQSDQRRNERLVRTMQDGLRVISAPTGVRAIDEGARRAGLRAAVALRDEGAARTLEAPDAAKRAQVEAQRKQSEADRQTAENARQKARDDSQARRDRILAEARDTVGLPMIGGVEGGRRARLLRLGATITEREGADEEAAQFRQRANRLDRVLQRQEARAVMSPLERAASQSFTPAMAALAFMFGGMPVTGLEGRLAMMQRPALSAGQLGVTGAQGLATQAALERLAAQGAPQRTALSRLGEMAATGAERAGLGGVMPVAAAALTGSANLFNLASVAASITGLIAAIAANTAATAANTAAQGGAAAAGAAGAGVGAMVRGAVVGGGALLGAGVAAVAADDLVRRQAPAQEAAIRAVSEVNPFAQLVNVVGQLRDWTEQLTAEDAITRIPESQRGRVLATTGDPSFDAFRRRIRDETALAENAPETVAFEQESLQRAQQIIQIRRQELSIQQEQRQEAINLGRLEEDQARARQQISRGYQRSVRDAYVDESRAIAQIEVQHTRSIRNIGVQFGRSREEARIGFEEQREDVREQAQQARQRQGRDFEFARGEVRQQTVEGREDVETNARRGFRNLIVGQIGGLAGGLISVALQKQDALADLQTREQRGLAAIGRQEARATGAGSETARDTAAALARIDREERRTLGPGGRLDRAEGAARADAEQSRLDAIADAQAATIARISQAATAYVDAAEDLARAQQTERERFNQDAAARQAQRTLALAEIEATRRLAGDFNTTVRDHLKLYQDLGAGLDDLMVMLGIRRSQPPRRLYRPE